ncbi:MAG: acyltransferase family protein [Methyloprofundus sp.]|nr:acyltransferase family protein [Methyloprofundus sp.]
MTTATIKFESLDALRGIAAIVVAIFHFSTGWGGYLIVDFFLVLSGFILSHSYLYKEMPTSPIEFISHRLARLYPLHFFTLFTFIIASLYIHTAFPQYADGTLFTLLQNLTLTQNIGFNPSGVTYNYPSWSISVEFWVNIIFILFVSKTTKSSTLFIIALIGLLIIYGNTGHLETQAKNYFTFINSGMIRGVSSFFLGILSYRMYLYYRHDRRIQKHINCLELLSMTGIFIVIFGRSDPLSSVDMFAPFLFMFVVAIFTFESGYLSTYLKKIKYLGEISYSIYLNQVTVLMLIRPVLKSFEMPSMLILAAYLVFLVIYSHFTYQYIEKPLRKKGRHMLLRISQKAAPSHDGAAP